MTSENNNYAYSLVVLTLTNPVPRSPGFMTGWGDALGDPKVNDGTPAILVGLMLYLIPSKSFFQQSPGSSSAFESLVSWKKVEKDIPWGIIILFGGGFALAEGCNRSGKLHMSCTYKKGSFWLFSSSKLNWLKRTTNTQQGLDDTARLGTFSIMAIAWEKKHCSKYQ